MDVEDFPRGPELKSKQIQSRAQEPPHKKRRMGTDEPAVIFPFHSFNPPAVDLQVSENSSSFQKKTIQFDSIQAPGNKVLGMVTEVTDTHLRVSLLYGLETTVDVAESSDFLAAVLHKEARQEATDKEMKRVDPDLTELFKPGQYVRGTFIRDEELAEVKLSLKLSHFYGNMALSSLREGAFISAVVQSIEDHGFILSFGSMETSGFLHRDDFGPYFEEGSTLFPGQLIHAVVKNSTSRGILHLSMNPELIQLALNVEGATVVKQRILPGELVHVKVAKILENGVVCKFSNKQKGLINQMHLQEEKEHYVKGQILKARVLYWNSLKSEFHLSVLDFLVQWTLPKMPAIIGQVFDSAQIQRIDDKGLQIKLPTQPVATSAYVHQSSLSDLSSVQAPDYYLHQNVRVRVTGFQAIDGLIVGSLKESVIRSGIISFDDVYPGLIAEGAVFRVFPDNVLISIAEEITALARHETSFPLPRLFQVGQIVQYRVLKLNSVRKHVLVSLDLRLINSELPFLTNWEDAEVGMQVIGYILAVKAHVVIVAFAGDLCGILPESETNLNTGESLASCFVKTKPVKVWIKSLNPTKQKMTLSMMKVDKGAVNTSDRLLSLQDHCKCPEGVNVGDVAQATVIKKLNDGTGFLVKLNFKELGSTAKAMLPYFHVADHPIVHNLIQDIQNGDDLGPVITLKTVDFLEVSRKPCLVRNASILPRSIEEVVENMLLPGFVQFVGREFVDVGFLDGLRGRVFSNQTPMTGISVQRQFYVGQTVKVRVLRVNLERGRINLSLNPSRTSGTDAVFLNEALLDPLLLRKEPVSFRDKLSTLCEAKVVEMGKKEAKCEISDHIQLKAVIPNQQLIEEVELGSVVSACVIDVTAEGTIILSSKPYFQQKGFQIKQKKKKKKKKSKSLQRSTYEAIVESLSSHYLVVSLPEEDHTLAKVPLSDYNIQFEDLSKLFKTGQTITVERALLKSKAFIGCPILTKSLQSLIWTVHPTTTSTQNIAGCKRNPFFTEQDEEILSAGRQCQVGDLISGFIQQVQNEGFAVHLTIVPNGQTLATVPFIDVFDHFTDQLTSVVYPGQAIRGFVRKFEQEQVVLSLRESDGGALEGISLSSQSTNCPLEFKRGAIDRGDVLYGYISHIGKKMDCIFVQVAQDIVATIHAPHFDDDPVPNLSDVFFVGQLIKGTIISLNYPKIGLSLRSGNKPLAEVGQAKHGVIVCILPHGTYVKLDESGIQGLVPNTEIKEHQRKAFKIGDNVQVMVDSSTNGFFLNLSVHEGAEETHSDLVEISESDDASVASDDFEEALRSAVQMEEEDDHQEPYEDSDSSLVSIESSEKTDLWTWESSKENIEDEKMKTETHLPVQTTNSSTKENVSARARVDPESIEDYERLLLADVNSSFLWIKYMAYFLEKGNVTKARSTAERALEMINFRHEQAKLDVWLAYLNLERAQGSSVESIMSLFQKAILSNNAKKLHLSFLKILEESRETEIGDLVIKSLRRRFPYSAKTCIQEIHYWLSTNRGGKCKESLERAIKVLPRRKHVKVLTKAALLEFKIGQVEHGRDIFEGLLLCYPKRTDLWNVYLDQELQLDDKEHARALLERASSLDMGRKRMKGIFKRYLQFESAHGTQKSMEMVKTKAKEYVIKKSEEMEDS